MGTYGVFNISRIFKLLILLFISIAVGILLLMGVYALPTAPMLEHVKESSRAFQIEGYYPVLDPKHNTLLDNWTDSVMLGDAIYPGEGESLLKKAVLVNRITYPDGKPVEELLNYVNGNPLNLAPQVSSYPRYWHGYLVILKPLLLFSDYLGFRDINHVMVWLVLGIACIGFVKQKKSIFILPFLLTVFFLRPDAIAYSLQFSTSYYIMMTAVILMVFLHRKFVEKRLYGSFFFLVGIITVYFDFLTYPLVTLGVPLTLYLVLEEGRSWKNQMADVIRCSILWALGYGGMWGGKWLLSCFVLGIGSFQDVLGVMKFRTSSHVGAETFSHIQVIQRNLQYYFGYRFFPLLILVFTAAVLLLALRPMKHAYGKLVPYLLVCCMPFAWYMVLANHSYIHSWMTYRTLAIFVFAYFCMGLQLVLLRKGSRGRLNLKKR